ncbi:unnamed protein product [Rotaria magnacalcarata]|uniref:Endonuclease/exonuclease/phosphatase domain-containing protein n=1 Tax=Rotaria magnacalcarata TaxID=392030 RepID=A0A819BJC6_9BILA|nr:unnamed protein product [Rotaria magnacalcarata]
MAQAINIGSNINHPSGNEYEICEEGSVPNVQVELISKFLSKCPEAALSVHKYLQKTYSKSNQQQQFVQPVNSTPKRDRPLDESGGSINNGKERRKYPRRGTDNNAQKHSHNVQQEISQHPQQSSSAMSSNERQHQEINQATTTNRKRISFNQLKHAIYISWLGREKLKLGVNNKEDYATLVGTDNWPTKINDIDIVVVKPKYVPDSFALVVRYVPRELDEDFVSNEIQRTIASADRIKRIHYSYQRRTDDYRFDVKDYSEYNAALQLGRIAIGHSWLSITKFYPGNRLTYCTRSQKNHSDKDVEVAIQKGLLQRFSPQEKSPLFEHREQDFPALTASDNHSNKKWNTALPRTTIESNNLRASYTDKTIESINDNLATLIDSNKRLENKVDLVSSNMKTVILDIQLHQAVLADTINIMKDFMQYVIPASLTASRAERSSLVHVVNEYYNRLHIVSSRLINSYQFNQLNHQVQLMSTSLITNTVQTDQQSVSIYKSTENANPRDEAMHQLEIWNLSPKDRKLVLSLLYEWYSDRTLNAVVEQWENAGIAPSKNQKEYIKILCYNVEGWGTRALEAIDLVYKIQASICIFTEVGELWNTCRLPHFNTFYQKGTNKNGGVCIAVGKHLKATRIEINIPNTVVIDIAGLSEPIRIIGIYWPTSQQRDLDEILPYVVDGTILSGDFNATVKEWNSPITDRRGAHLKEWINESNLDYIPLTSNSSKRSLRNIDLSFSNMSTISSETLFFGTSDHWSIMLSCENFFFRY